VVGTRPIAGPPFQYSGVDRWIRTPAPLIGQHNHEVLSEIGLSAEEIAALEAADVVGDRPLGL
jgi:crotonobetainyl-CoA:carnitine CoA-transferase CaiB-like acyl-CoA transferase